MQINYFLFTVIGAFKPLNGGRAEFRGFVGPFDGNLSRLQPGLFGQFGGAGPATEGPFEFVRAPEGLFRDIYNKLLLPRN